MTVSLQQLMDRINAGSTPDGEYVPNGASLSFVNNFSLWQSSTFLKDRFTNNINTFSTKFKLGVKPTVLALFLANDLGMFVSDTGEATLAKTIDSSLMVSFTENRDVVEVSIMGEHIDVEKLKQVLQDKFPANYCYIDWVYDPQYLSSVSMSLNTDNIPVNEMYPFLDEDLTSYYDRFNSSTANILVLIGPPGVGKTSFIRGLLAHSKKSATLTYNRKIIEQDEFFVEWYNSKNDFMVLEDSDNLLLPREDGNDLMARFLNLGDGLMSVKNKKMIFSTNLPNVADIDEALTRPGRCFDILEFGYLNREESTRLCNKMNIPLPDGDKFTLSELFASTKNEVKAKRTKQFGFI